MKSFYKKVKEAFYRPLYALPFSLKAGNELISSSNEGINTGTEITKQVEDKRVANHLLKGEVTQSVEELRYRTYKVDELSRTYEVGADGSAKKKKPLKKRNFNVFKLGQDNRKLTQNIEDTMKAVDSRMVDEYLLHVEYTEYPMYHIEAFVSRFELEGDTSKEWSTTMRLHFPKLADISDVRSQPFINKIIKFAESGNIPEQNIYTTDIKEMSFSTYRATHEENFVNYCLCGEHKLIKAEETSDDVVLTYKWQTAMRASVILSEKYYSESMDKKYKAKTEKEQQVGLVKEPEKFFCEKCGKEVPADDANNLKSFGQKVMCDNCLMEKDLNS